MSKSPVFYKYKSLKIDYVNNNISIEKSLKN
jgi:hypothetical protein